MAPLFSLVGKVIVNIVQLGKIDSLVIRNIEALTQPDRFMDALVRRKDGFQSLFSPMTVHVTCQTNRIEEKHHLE